MVLALQEMDPTNLLFVFIILSITFLLFLFFCVCKLFFTNSDRNEYTFIGSEILSSGDVPHEFLNDEESLTHLADEFDFTSLSPEEQSAYLKGEEFTKIHPRNFHHTRGKSFSVEDDHFIRDRGITAFEFEQEAEILQARYIVADRTEIHFLNNDTPYSTTTSVLNYALPVKNRTYSDTVYFEVKVFEFNNETPNAHFSIGLVTKPYPSQFRLPGYNNFSIGYESTGNLKINKPFPTPLQQHQGEQSQYNALVLPPLQQSDTVGFGFFIPTGTIFITRNGKKIMDVMKGCFLDLYPAIGCFSTNAKFQVNLGQLGFVWIEANVRKYGFVSTSDYKKIKGERGLAALPEYGDVLRNDGDKLLDKGEELPPRYPEEELDFFGRSTNVGSSSKVQSKLARGEKSDDKEIEENKEIRSSSQITNEPEEVMDLRERLYEQNITSDNDKISESVPLTSGDPQSYHSVELEESESAGEQTSPIRQEPSNKENSSREGTPSMDDIPTSSSQGVSKPTLANGSNGAKNSKIKKKKKQTKKNGKKKNKKK